MTHQTQTTENGRLRDLDRAVAEAMGWTDVRYGTYCVSSGKPNGPYMTTGLYGTDSNGCPSEGVPYYTSPSCSGLGPVLAWLRENQPKGYCLNLTRPGYSEPGYEEWEADYYGFEESAATAWGATLPEAAARLVIAWAGRKG